jgi:hypothetical protein
VGIVNATPSFTLDVNGAGSSMCARISSGSGTGLRFDTTRNIGGLNRNYLIGPDLLNEGWFAIIPSTALGGGTFTNSIYNASSDGIHAWGNGAGGELMRLNSTGLGVGGSPVSRLSLGADANTDGSNKFTLYRGGFSGQYSVIENIGGTAYRSYGTGGHIWYVNNGTTEAGRFDGSGNLGVGVATPSYRLQSAVASGADGNIFAAQVTGASNGFQILWNHATTTTRVIIANIPTSSAGLAAGTLWNDAGTIKIA